MAQRIRYRAPGMPHAVDADELLDAVADAVGVARHTIEPLRAALQVAWDAAEAAWPGAPVTPLDLARAWVRALAGAPPEGIADLHPDVRLAASSLGGHAAAIRLLDDACLRPIAASLARRGWAAADLDDVLQVVRARLLVASPARPGQLATYGGRSSLRAWLRVVVTREALARRPALHDSVPTDAALAGDPIAGWLDVAHGEHVRAGLRAAVLALPSRQRAALRMEYVDRLPHGAIAKIYGVHRTSVLRWCEEARAAIAGDLRRYLVRTLNLPLAEIDSHLRGVGSRLDLSLAALLASTPSAD